MKVGARRIREEETYTVEDFFNLGFILKGFGHVNERLKDSLLNLLFFYCKDAHALEFFDCILDRLKHARLIELE
jgi:hypothetical protein